MVCFFFYFAFRWIKMHKGLWKRAFSKLGWQLRYKRCYLFNGFDGGGAKEHITLTAEFCGTKMSLGGELVEITGSGGDGGDTGGASDSCVHRLTHFLCSHSPPWPLRDKEKKKTEDERQILDRRVELLHLSLRGKSAIRGTFSSR